MADTAVLAVYSVCFMTALVAMLYARTEWLRWGCVIVFSAVANLVTLMHLFTHSNQ